MDGGSFRDTLGTRLIKRRVHEDARGSFSEIWSTDRLESDNLFIPYQSNFSRSGRGVFRGFHLQEPPHSQKKLVSVLSGRVMDFFIDLDPKSPTLGEMGYIELSEERDSLLIPESMAHGFLSLEEDTMLCYQVDTPYWPDSEISISPQSEGLKLFDFFKDLGIAQVIMSEKDQSGINLAHYLSEKGWQI